MSGGMEQTQYSSVFSPKVKRACSCEGLDVIPIGRAEDSTPHGEIHDPREVRDLHIRTPLLCGGSDTDICSFSFLE